jgi:hypothetical protein
MEKLNPIELNNVLKDVRNSYRVLALYQQRIIDTVKYIGNQYNLEFHSGWTKFAGAASNGKRAKIDNASGWDWLTFYLYEFNMGNVDIEGKKYSFKIVHQADTGYYDANTNEKVTKRNVENFAEANTSQTRLFFVLSENANGCPIHNILSKGLTSGTNEPFRNGNWLAAPYDISMFLNEQSTDEVIKNFNGVCAKEFEVNLLNIEDISHDIA